MAARTVDLQREQTIRDLRLRIGRLRRRIDTHLRRTGQSGRDLLDWQTYVRRAPGVAVMGALGAGLALSAGLRRGRLSRWLGLRLLRRAFDRFVRIAWRELGQIWTASTPNRTNAPGADDECCA